jgi:Haem-binding domain/Cytochrome P460
MQLRSFLIRFVVSRTLHDCGKTALLRKHAHHQFLNLVNMARVSKFLSTALGRTLVSLIVLFGLLQFARPELNRTPASAELQAPAAVTQILKQSCYSCHSNERRLSWFDEIVPAYWLVAHDVKQARKHLNFSELGGRSPAEQRAALFQAVNFIEKGVMPIRAYTRLHPRAVVGKTQLAVLQGYLLPKMPPIASASTIEASNEEYRRWISSVDKTAAVQPSPNGIAFLPDYKNWKFIASTVRFDAYTMRVILGNDVAIKAIADNRTNPWPDGTTFAKVGWFQQPDEHGLIRAGAFFKVGFMIKDSVKYASTAGWGWAEWAGTQHKPYGDGPDFARECVTCHNPQRKSDYTYTTPIQFVKRPGSVVSTSNGLATLAGDIDVDPLRWNVVTCGADPRDSTMSTLYGNDIAVQYSRTHAEGTYPVGAALALVTWHQQDDGNWFGAKMPAETKSMELVTVSASGNGGTSYRYKRYEGSPLKEVTSSESQADERTAYIRSRRAAVMP